jgi:AraC-like DNA-binding protein
MHEHLDGELNLATLAGECGLSVSHFARSFKISFGAPVHRYLITQRLESAKDSLLHTNKSLADIAFQVGFSDQAAFSRTFAALVGTTPGRWRRENARPGGLRTNLPLRMENRQSSKLMRALNCRWHNKSTTEETDRL